MIYLKRSLIAFLFLGLLPAFLLSTILGIIPLTILTPFSYIITGSADRWFMWWMENTAIRIMDGCM